MIVYQATNEVNKQTEATRKLVEAKEKQVAAEKKLINERSRDDDSFRTIAPMTAKGIPTLELKAPTLMGVDKFKAQSDAVLTANKKMSKGISDNLLNLSGVAAQTAEGFGEFLGNLASGQGNVGGFAAFVEGAFATLAMSVGKQMIAFGTAGLALKIFFKDPMSNIAAGIALVALGTLAQNSIGASISNAGGVGGAVSGGGQNFNFDTRSSTPSFQTQKISVEVTGKLSADGKGLSAALTKENTRVSLAT